jgi:hypothetical protein
MWRAGGDALIAHIQNIYHYFLREKKLFIKHERLQDDHGLAPEGHLQAYNLTT